MKRQSKNHLATGFDAEESAAAFLRDAGLELLARNYRKKVGELDIVAYEPASDQLVFVEVRTRSNPRYCSASASVDRRKQAKLIRTAQLFLREHPGYAQRSCRFDVIAFEPPQSGATRPMRWIKRAFTS